MRCGGKRVAGLPLDRLRNEKGASRLGAPGASPAIVADHVGFGVRLPRMMECRRRTPRRMAAARAFRRFSARLARFCSFDSSTVWGLVTFKSILRDRYVCYAGFA